MRLTIILIILLADFVISSKNRILLNKKRIPHWKKLTGFGLLNQGPYYGQPEQVHLSYAGDLSRLYVTWLTFDDTENSRVEYGTKYLLKQSVNATIDYFVDNGKDKIFRFLHRALIQDLQPGQRYFYRVGSQYGWSSVFSFVGLKERSDGGYRYAVYGDMGNINARSLGKIQRIAQSGNLDMILHVGDMAYNLDTDQGKFGDEFMRQLEPVAAYVPYMTVVGNHEQEFNFSHYINRFTMPKTKDNLFYSFDIGKAHFIAFSTEFYFFLEYGFEQIARQWQFLKNDLQKANENRAEVPWIITMGHRPMYCSNLDFDDCTNYDSIIRTGIPGVHAFALENLFFKYGVDLEFWAHEHSYERMYPVYNRTVYNGTYDNPYVDPPSPVHIVTGSAGCQENTDKFIEDPGPWSAFRSSNYGFGQMQIFNTTHLYYEQILAGKDIVEDSFWLIKNLHQQYTKSDVHKLRKYGTYVP